MRFSKETYADFECAVADSGQLKLACIWPKHNPRALCIRMLVCGNCLAQHHRHAGFVPLLTVLCFCTGIGVCVPIFMAVFVSDSVAPAQKEAICCKARVID